MYIHIITESPMPNPKDYAVTTSPYPCFCALIRKAGRIVTRNYDKYLKPCGLKATQLSMLSKIAKNPDTAVSALAESLRMDQTTVSRNLQVLEKSGFIHLEDEMTDHRIKRIRITDLGVSKMNEAIPLWEQAQLDMERVLGRESIEEMMKTLKKLTK
jgi:DNA-binding MarR family transcriptional regulator